MTIDFTKVKEGSFIEYTGDSFAYGGQYEVVSAESTFIGECPEYLQGKLMIIEFMNNGDPMFIRVENLKSNEWRLVDGKN